MMQAGRIHLLSFPIARQNLVNRIEPSRSVQPSVTPDSEGSEEIFGGDFAIAPYGHAVLEHLPVAGIPANGGIRKSRP